LGERVNVTAEAGDRLNVRDCPAVRVPVDVEMPIISPQYLGSRLPSCPNKKTPEGRWCVFNDALTFQSSYHITHDTYTAGGNKTQKLHTLHFAPSGAPGQRSSTRLGAHPSRKAAMSAMQAHASKFKAMKSLTTGDLDLIKAHKSGKRCVVGHTSTGKPIHSDAHGAEGYTEDEHREAEEIHRDIGERLVDVAHGHNMFGGTRGKLPHAARKYLADIGQKHSLIGRRHGKTAMDHSSARYAKERAAQSGGYVEPQAFLSDAAKSLAVSLSNNPTDADIAKAIEAGGGGEALVESMEVRAPMNVHNPLGGMLVLNKPSSTRTS
jgi:hypothetical protein